MADSGKKPIEFNVEERLSLRLLYNVFRIRNTEIEECINRIMGKNGMDRKAGYRGCKVRPNIMQSQINQNELVIAIMFKIEGTDNDPAGRYIKKTIGDTLAIGTGLQSHHITADFRKALEGKFLRPGIKESDVYCKEVALNHIGVYLDYTAVLGAILGAKIEDVGITKIIPVGGKDKETWEVEIGVVASAGVYDPKSPDEDLDASNIPANYL